MLVAMTSGCRFARDDGHWYGTADANTVGRPAVILDRVRTDSYRVAPPALQQTQVAMIRLPNPQAEPHPAPPVSPEEYTGTTPLLDLTLVSFETPAETEPGQRPQRTPSTAWLFR